MISPTGGSCGALGLLLCRLVASFSQLLCCFNGNGVFKFTRFFSFETVNK